MTLIAISRILLAIFFLLSAVSVVSAAPLVAFPVNSQLPPVAYVGSVFSFTFSSDTFSTAASELTYALADSASWLNLDSTSRTLSGTPASSDLGSAVFQLVATDTTGSTTMPVTLVIGSKSSIGITRPPAVSNLLGGTSLNNSFSFPPGNTISFALDNIAFTGTDEHTSYYAVCGDDNSPLPSWLLFDAKTMSFSGTSPAATSSKQSPLRLVIRVVATNIPGFSEATYSFKLSIAPHQLQFTSSTLALNITTGQGFSIAFKDYLMLDSQPVIPGRITQVNADFPSWLSIDVSSLILSGIAPQDAANASFDISALDVYEDVAKATVNLWVTKGTHLFNSTVVPKVIANIGQDISYTIPPELFVVEGLKTSIDFGNCSSWLHYDPTTLSVSGSVPNDMTPQIQSFNLSVTDGSASAWENITFELLRQTTPSTTTPPTPTNTYGFPSPWESWVPPDSPWSYDNAQPKIAKGIGIGIAIVVVLIAIWMLWSWKKYGSLPCCGGTMEETAENEVWPSDHSTRQTSCPGATPWDTDRSVPPVRLGAGTALLEARTFGYGFQGHTVFGVGGAGRSRNDKFAPMACPSQTHGRNSQQPALGRGRPLTYIKPLEPEEPVSPFGKDPADDSNEFKEVDFNTSTPAKIPASMKELRIKAEQARRATLKKSTIRQVEKSPEPSIIAPVSPFKDPPPPPPSASPRKKLSSFIHDRAVELKTLSGYNQLASLEKSPVTSAESVHISPVLEDLAKATEKASPVIHSAQEDGSPIRISPNNLNRSPRKVYSSYIHERATVRKKSGLFSAHPTTRRVEDEIIGTSRIPRPTTSVRPRFPVVSAPSPSPSAQKHPNYPKFSAAQKPAFPIERLSRSISTSPEPTVNPFNDSNHVSKKSSSLFGKDDGADEWEDDIEKSSVHRGSP